MNVPHRNESELRDHLSLHRTIMANEQTLLAYTRTALTFFAFGAAILQFFHPGILHIIGWLMMPLGTTCILIGILRYRQVRQTLDETHQEMRQLEQ